MPPSGTTTAGSSTGEADAITVNYDVAGLSPATYSAVITISAAGASNSPQTVAVTLVVEPEPPPDIPGDFDDDLDVDLADFGFMQKCLSGPAIPHQSPQCDVADFDGDDDVDGLDVLLFRGCLTGAALPGDPDCME